MNPLKLFPALALACLLPSSSLLAFDYAGKVALTGFVGYDTFAMGDVNKTLNQVGGSITDGYEFGGGLSYGVTHNVMLTLGLCELRNQDSFNGGTISLPALSTYLREDYFFTNVAKNLDLSIGGGLEYDVLDGNTSVDPNGPAASIKSSGWAGSPGGGGGVTVGTAPSGAQYVLTNCQGSTIGVLFSVGARYFVLPRLSINTQVGYRYSHIYAVTGTTDGQTGPEDETVDYSGLITRLEASYYFF